MILFSHHWFLLHDLWPPTKRFDKLKGMALFLKVPRTEFVLFSSCAISTLILGISTTVSAFTQVGCKDASLDPSASSAKAGFEAGLPGWCRTKRAGAIFSWFSFGGWVVFLVWSYIAFRRNRGRGNTGAGGGSGQDGGEQGILAQSKERPFSPPETEDFEDTSYETPRYERAGRGEEGDDDEDDRIGVPVNLGRGKSGIDTTGMVGRAGTPYQRQTTSRALTKVRCHKDTPSELTATTLLLPFETMSCSLNRINLDPNTRHRFPVVTHRSLPNSTNLNRISPKCIISSHLHHHSHNSSNNRNSNRSISSLRGLLSLLPIWHLPHRAEILTATLVCTSAFLHYLSFSCTTLSYPLSHPSMCHTPSHFAYISLLLSLYRVSQNAQSTRFDVSSARARPTSLLRFLQQHPLRHRP